MRLQIAFYKAKFGHWDDKLIDCYTGRGGYSHCELVINGRCFSASQREGKVRWANINLGERWKLVDISPHDIDTVKLTEFINRVNDADYDYWGIVFSQMIPIGYHKEGQWFCSEVVAEALRLAGHPKLQGKSTNHIHPNGLERILCP